MNGLTLQVPTPFVSYDEFSRLTGLPINTIKNMVADGRLKIRPKIRAKEKPLINMVALYQEAAVQSQVIA